MAGWIAEGKLIAREDIVEGFDSFPESLAKSCSQERTWASSCSRSETVAR